MARAAIQRHLMSNVAASQPLIKSKVFKSPRDPDFYAYLEATGIYFVMCHDGASEKMMTSEENFIEDADWDSSIANVERFRKTQFRAMIFTLIHRGYNVALINGLDFIDTKVNEANGRIDFADSIIILGASNGG